MRQETASRLLISISHIILLLGSHCVIKALISNQFLVRRTPRERRKQYKVWIQSAFLFSLFWLLYPQTQTHQGQFRIRGAAVSLSCHGTRGRVHPVQIASLLQDRLKPFTPNFTDHQTDCITITMLLAYLKVVEEVVLDMLKGAWLLEAHSASLSRAVQSSSLMFHQSKVIS